MIVRSNLKLLLIVVISLSSAYLVPAGPCRAFAEDWAARFLSEAPKAWGELIERCAPYERVWSVTIGNALGTQSRARSIYKRNGDCFAFINEGAARHKDAKNNRSSVRSGA